MSLAFDDVMLLVLFLLSIDTGNKQMSIPQVYVARVWFPGGNHTLYPTSCWNAIHVIYVSLNNTLTFREQITIVVPKR